MLPLDFARFMWGDWPEKIRGSQSGMIEDRIAQLPKGAARKILRALLHEYQFRWNTSVHVLFESFKESLASSEKTPGSEQERPFSVRPIEQTRLGVYLQRETPRAFMVKLPTPINSREESPKPFDEREDWGLARMLTLRALGLPIEVLREVRGTISSSSQSQILDGLAELGLVWFSEQDTPSEAKILRQREKGATRKPKPAPKKKTPVIEGGRWKPSPITNPRRVELTALGYVVAERLFDMGRSG